MPDFTHKLKSNLTLLNTVCEVSNLFSSGLSDYINHLADSGLFSSLELSFIISNITEHLTECTSIQLKGGGITCVVSDDPRSSGYSFAGIPHVAWLHRKVSTAIDLNVLGVVPSGFIETSYCTKDEFLQLLQDTKGFVNTSNLDEDFKFYVNKVIGSNMRSPVFGKKSELYYTKVGVYDKSNFHKLNATMLSEYNHFIKRWGSDLSSFDHFRYHLISETAIRLSVYCKGDDSFLSSIYLWNTTVDDEMHTTVDPIIINTDHEISKSIGLYNLMHLLAIRYWLHTESVSIDFQEKYVFKEFMKFPKHGIQLYSPPNSVPYLPLIQDSNDQLVLGAGNGLRSALKITQSKVTYIPTLDIVRNSRILEGKFVTSFNTVSWMLSIQDIEELCRTNTVYLELIEPSFATRKSMLSNSSNTNINISIIDTQIFDELFISYNGKVVAIVSKTLDGFQLSTRLRTRELNILTNPGWYEYYYQNGDLLCMSSPTLYTYVLWSKLNVDLSEILFGTPNEILIPNLLLNCKYVYEQDELISLPTNSPKFIIQTSAYYEDGNTTHYLNDTTQPFHLEIQDT